MDLSPSSSFRSCDWRVPFFFFLSLSLFLCLRSGGVRTKGNVEGRGERGGGGGRKQIGTTCSHYTKRRRGRATLDLLNLLPLQLLFPKKRDLFLALFLALALLTFPEDLTTSRCKMLLAHKEKTQRKKTQSARRKDDGLWTYYYY